MDEEGIKRCPECNHKMKLKDDSVGEIYYECINCGSIYIPDNYLSSRISLNAYYRETLDYVESEAPRKINEELEDDDEDEKIQKKTFKTSSFPHKTITFNGFSTSTKQGMTFKNVYNAIDILELQENDLINKSSLYNAIVESRKTGSRYYIGPEYEIKNSPQQGINWVGNDYIPTAVIVKSKFGHYHQDDVNEYAFKARNGFVNKSEKANQVLINQPKYNYPIFYFVEYGNKWKLLGLFRVSAINARSVSLLPWEATNKEKEEIEAPAEVTQKKEEKTIIRSVTVQRSASPLNGKCKFIKKDGSYILADEKGMENSALSWSGQYVKLNIFKIEDGIITDWNWEKIE